VPVSKKPPRNATSMSSRPKAAVADGALPDRRAMESYLASIAGQGRDDAIAKAQDVMYDAWDRAPFALPLWISCGCHLPAAAAVVEDRCIGGAVEEIVRIVAQESATAGRGPVLPPPAWLAEWSRITKIVRCVIGNGRGRRLPAPPATLAQSVQGYR
jgi:hypothetical protein